MPWGWRRKSWNWGGGYGSSKSKKSKSKKNRSYYSSRAEENYLASLQWPSFPLYEDSVASIVDLTTSDDIGDDELDHQILFGSVRGNVVGLQYYSGMVSGHEMVSLVREPENRYDHNAIKVIDVMGHQVGHIKRELAAPLSNIVDGNIARIEGVVPYGQNNTYSMPIDISLWGRAEKREEASQKLRRCGYMLKDPEYGGNKSSGSGSSTSTYKPKASYGPAIALSTEQMKNELDKLFDDNKDFDQTITDQPADAIATTLFPHQKQALAWMKARENNEDLPPFWEEKNGNFINSLINFKTSKRPSSLHGGILADDMGLGKTLEMISLIMSNFYDAKPLAVPVVGLEKDSKKKRNGKKKTKKTSSSSDNVVVTLDSGDESETVESGNVKEEEIIEDESDISGVDEPLVAMTSKEDPAYSPHLVKTAAKTLSPVVITSRPTRTKKKPVRYTYSIRLNQSRNNSRGKGKRKTIMNDEVCEDMEITNSNISKKCVSQGKGTKKGKGKGKGKSVKKKTDIADEKTVCIIPSTVTESCIPSTVTESCIPSTVTESCIPSTVTESCMPSTVTESCIPSTVTESCIPSTVTESCIPSTVNSSVSQLSNISTALSNTSTATASKPGCSNQEYFIVDDDDDDDYLPDPQLLHADLAVDLTGKVPAKGPRPALIVCPLSVLSNWLDQFEEHVKPNVDVRLYTYYGNERTKFSHILSQQDVVLTTYNTLAMEFKTLSGKGPIHTTDWLRVVLDEGHCIRNPKALQTKAAYSLKSQRRWVLTGTPIQNSMKDLFSVISFLRLEPLNERQWWQRTIERPIQHGNKAALILVQRLMKGIAMRRTKTQKVNGKPLVELPDKKVFLQTVELSDDERALYETMAKEGRVKIGKYFRAGTLLANYGDVLAILLRLRQLCCHPGLCAAAVAAAAAAVTTDNGDGSISEEQREKLVKSLLAVLNQGSDEECCICLDSLTLPVITHCAHVFCKMCIESVIKNEQNVCIRFDLDYFMPRYS
uniref:Helicase-like transcription factor-like n=1 Tax=Saccoglossus kowalevskii TaxID=10224 RepID=A0ABM0MXG7_SACKO|nr:PREDICTED: helicase-like transcription factor-like [Saccoglossus kowalevskii]